MVQLLGMVVGEAVDALEVVGAVEAVEEAVDAVEVAVEAVVEAVVAGEAAVEFLMMHGAVLRNKGSPLGQTTARRKTTGPR